MATAMLDGGQVEVVAGAGLEGGGEVGCGVIEGPARVRLTNAPFTGGADSPFPTDDRFRHQVQPNGTMAQQPRRTPPQRQASARRASEH